MLFRALHVARRPAVFVDFETSPFFRRFRSPKFTALNGRRRLVPNLGHKAVWNGGLSKFEHAFLIGKHFVQTAFVRPPWLLGQSWGFQMTINRFLWVVPTLRNLLKALGTLGKCWESSKGDSYPSLMFSFFLYLSLELCINTRCHLHPILSSLTA